MRIEGCRTNRARSANLALRFSFQHTLVPLISLPCPRSHLRERSAAQQRVHAAQTKLQDGILLFGVWVGPDIEVVGCHIHAIGAVQKIRRVSALRSGRRACSCDDREIAVWRHISEPLLLTGKLAVLNPHEDHINPRTAKNSLGDRIHSWVSQHRFLGRNPRHD